MADHLKFATSLARRAGDLLGQFFSPAGIAATRKADRSLVTEADVAADRFIAATVGLEYPGEVMLTEELHCSPEETDAPIWVVDPLDGTTNFSLGLHHWGVSIARLVDGWPETGVAYFPLLNECYAAQRGQGATLNGKPLHILPTDGEWRERVFACCSRTHRFYRVSVPYKTRLLGSTAFNLCAVARGAAVVGFDATAKVWDLAAGWLIVEESGGAAGVLDGNSPFPVTGGLDYNQQRYPLLAAASRETFESASSQLVPRTDQSG
jgi:myo-inositol-1(or 4)-monophosphatase